LVEAKANAHWSLDFMHDQFANGQRFRILNVVDDVTKERLGTIRDTSAAFWKPCSARLGKASMIVSDNGSDFTATPCSPGAETT